MSEITLQKTNPLQQLAEFESKLQKTGGDTKSVEFGQVLSEAIQDVDKAQRESNERIQQMLSGDIQDVHSAMIAVQKADLSFQMMMQVRNKLIDAYQEIMRMQV
jgi:flagellar hook-basal body complex protein FliE